MTPEEKRKAFPELYELTKQLAREITDLDGVSKQTLKDVEEQVRKILKEFEDGC